MSDAAGWLAGVDEAGRGPLAGPVVAAAVILPEGYALPGLGDSKALTHAQRERLAPLIREQAVAWGLGVADAAEIDAHNILRATHLAMRRALQALAVTPAQVIVDGNRLPGTEGLAFSARFEARVKADASVPAVSAASILAKTWRDDFMLAQDALYPGYGFAVHKGYPVPAHREALQRLGPCPLHRRSYAPVQLALQARSPAAVPSTP